MDGDLKMLLVGGLICLFLVCGGCGGCYGLSHVDYSDGYRDGIVEKVSHKGMIFKTDEGIMVLGGLVAGDGTTHRKEFHFTVNDPEVLKQLEALPPGRKVRLHYAEKVTAWRPKGDTSYFITKVEPLEDKK